jgi:hypothetical protein
MARAEVVQIKCDRCRRVELLPPTPPKSLPDFEARFIDKKLVYEDLCSRCRVAVENCWKDLVEWDRVVNQPFGPQVIAPNVAPPLVPAPSFTPPKPHSMANADKK